MKKILFLDIDGVVNCATTMQRHRGAIGIDPYMAFLVGKIVLDTGCDIVLSSTWRCWPDARDEVRRQVGNFIDITPRMPLLGGSEQMERGKEIKAWLEQHPDVDRYAILDDGSDFFSDQPLFKTSWQTGINEKIANEVTVYLNQSGSDPIF